MKFTCTQENLSRGLAIVARLSEKSTNLPILNNVLIEARKDGIVLTTTNLEIGIRTTIRGKVDVEGSFTVPARLTADFVNTLKKENVTIELHENELAIKGDDHQTVIKGLDASEFPSLPEIENDYSVTIAQAEFKEALGQVVFSMSADESRPELNGALLQFEAPTGIFVATDSFRLSEKKIPITSSSKERKQHIVPARTLLEVLRVLDQENEENAELRINDTQIQFVFGPTQIISRVVNGEYPDYQQIIPKEFVNEVEFSVSEMTQAIKTTALFCKQGINDIRLALDKRFADITIQAENSIHGKNVSHVKSYSKNQEVDIVFNYKFLLQGLQHITSETAVLKTNSATSPALVTTKKDTGLVYIIMPIRQ